MGAVTWDDLNSWPEPTTRAEKIAWAAGAVAYEALPLVALWLLYRWLTRGP